MSEVDVIVDPMPDELFSSHEHRRRHFLGARIVEQQYRDLLKEESTLSRRPGRIPMATLAARASGIDPKVYIAQHTMLPSLRVADYEVSEDHAEQVGWTSQAFHHAETLPCGEARLCLACIECDLGTEHTSWFRRGHHHVGIDRCLYDGHPLYRVLSRSPFSRLPHQWMRLGLIDEVAGEAPDEQNPAWFKRYCDVTVALSGRGKPVQSRRLNRRLSEQAKKKGYRTKIEGSEPLLSAALFELAGNEWLRNHVTSARTSQVGEWIPTIDGLTYSLEFSRPGYLYAMLLATLSESVAAAMEIMNFCSSSPLHT